MDRRCRAIFLDRDGVINRERADYVKSWAEFELLPGVLEALRRLAMLGWPILIVTNQSAIGRGLVPAATVEAIHRQLAALVEAAGGRLDGFFVCAHQPSDDCDCRKPRPGLLEHAAARFNLDLSQCYFLGDALSDLQAARAAGCRPILVQTGLQGPRLAGSLNEELAAPLLTDLAAAVDLILAEAIDP